MLTLLALLLHFPMLAQENKDEILLPTTASRAEFNSFIRTHVAHFKGKESTFDARMHSLREWTFHHGDTNDRLNLEYEKAAHFRQIGQLKLAIAKLGSIMRSETSSDSLIFMSTRFSRDLYFQLEAYEMALQLHESLDWNAAPDSPEKLTPEYFIGLLYYRIGDYNKAIRIYQQSIETMRLNQKHFLEMNYINNLGLAYEKRGDLDSAWTCYVRAAEILEEHIVPLESYSEKQIAFIRGLYLGNQAQILAQKGLHLEAIPLYKMDINASMSDTGDANIYENGIISMIKLSKSYLAIGALDKTRAYLNQAHRNLYKVETIEVLESYYDVKSQFYERTHLADSALFMLKKRISLRDSVLNHQSIIKSKNMLIAHESMMQEKALQAQNERIAELQRRASFQRDTNLVFALAIILALIITGVTVYRSKARVKQQSAIQQKNKEIEVQKQTIEASLKEKEILLREVNHRVKNNLQIISSLLYMQGRNSNDPNVQRVMQEAQRRVQTMSTIHQKLYQESQFNNIPFSTYVTDLVHQVISGYKMTDQNIATDLQITLNEIPMNMAVPISLIVHELVTNSIKHAFPFSTEGLISIAIHEIEHTLLIYYRDNGIGMDTQHMHDQSSHIGLKVIQLLSQQMGADFVISSHHPLFIQLSIPID